MRATLLLHAVLLAGVIGASSDTVTEDGSMGQQMTPAAVSLPIEGEMPSLDGATTWLNSPPLTPAALRGKVVLIDFWTYTCINWLRTLPYVRAWAEKYKEQGLVVIGVSTPEFEFEHTVEAMIPEAFHNSPRFSGLLAAFGFGLLLLVDAATR